MTGTYNGWLQLLSFVVAVIASHVALDLASRVSSSSERAIKYWLVAGAVAMGTGIWSMHFVGMLAFKLPIQMGYDVSLTLASWAIAVLASGFALFTINRNKLSGGRLLASGLLMGLGIASMHYVGMAAMRMSPAIEYDPLLFGMSVVIAIGASIAALWICFTLRSDAISHIAGKRFGAAVVMGIAIVGMHYTGMAAARFASDSICMGNPSQIGNFWMALTIAGCTLLFLASTMLISVFDARLASSTAKLAKSLQASNASLTEEVRERERAEQALHESNGDLLRLKVAAEAANQAKSEFLANVSHELRTPLTLILAPLEQLLASKESPVDWRRQIERVQRNALLLLNRVNDILDFSKAEAEKFEVRWEAVDLAELLSTMVGDAIPAAEGKGCQLLCHVQPDFPAVGLDRAHFEKIFLNLLSNALKFTPSGGTVRVEASVIDAGTYELSVSDSGIGIAPDKLPLLFNRFQQIDNSATRAYSGTGIGLALVKQLVTLMGGNVHVTSEVGMGSRFAVRLPIGQERVSEPAREPGSDPQGQESSTRALLRSERLRESQQQGADGSGVTVDNAMEPLPTVLVADDNPDMLRYITELLSQEYRILTASHGLHAWALLQEQKVDLVLSDVMMPELDGLALTARIKQDARFSHLPVILVTARGGSDASVSGLETGADDYVAKPFSPSELRARLRAALRMADVHAKLREKSREAGMAVVANGILHNLGNILNGVTVSSGVIQEQLHQSKIPKLQMVASLLSEHEADLPTFIAQDGRGKLLPAFITQLSEHLETELRNLTKEVEALRACTEHVSGVIATQQEFAQPHRGVSDFVVVDDLMAKALKLSMSAFEMRGIDVVCDLSCKASVVTDTHKVLQILLNLLGNARHAVQERPPAERRVWLTTDLKDGSVCMRVRDNGVGLAPEHLPKVFNQGFTTKSDGHGIGLHTSANWARELGGSLACHSGGLGAGATFTLELPRPDICMNAPTPDALSVD
jgi:signal transduction histidine kinase